MLKQAVNRRLFANVGLGCLFGKSFKSSLHNSCFKNSKASYLCTKRSLSTLNENLNGTFSLTSAGSDSFNNQIQSEWMMKLNDKQLFQPYTKLFKKISHTNDALVKTSAWTSNLQHVLSIISSNPLLLNDSTDKKIIDMSVKSFKGLKSEESALVLVFHCIIKSLCPKYENQLAEETLKILKNQMKIEPHQLYLSEESLKSSIFGKDIGTIIANPDVQISVQFLKRKIAETQNWKLNVECRDDNIFQWINSLLETSTTNSLLTLSKSKNKPAFIVYDLLLRQPKSELEYKCFFEFYESYSCELNLIDQEKLHLLKQFDLNFDRNLIIPPMFKNLFDYALRNKIDQIPILLNLFLKENHIADKRTLDQLGEMMWILSFDHSGEHINSPSKYHQISQTMLIKVINEIIVSERSLELDVSTMLGVSNLAYFKNKSKSIKMFNAAQKQFDHWQIQSFKQPSFKRVTPTSPHTSNISSSILNEMKIDYNIKFLCNSILLLSVDSENCDIIKQDLCGIFANIEPHVLFDYPEVYHFLFTKLHYHDMLDQNLNSNFFHQYLTRYKKDGFLSPLILDTFITTTNKFKIIQRILEDISWSDLDDNNIAHIISKLYKIAQSPIEEDVVGDPLQIARDLYTKAGTMSSRINSAYLLGEAAFTPLETCNRYMSLNDHFKVTTHTISSLFISVLRMPVGQQDISWNDQKPIDFALQEFNKQVAKEYGDVHDGLIYPNDQLFTVYIESLQTFKRTKELGQFLFKLVDLKYPLSEKLFRTYLDTFDTYDSRELIDCLNLYQKNFEILRACGTEWKLKETKKRLPVVKAKGKFESFVKDLEMNWEIIGRWDWPKN